MAGLGDGLTDGEAETCTLYIVVEFKEALEELVLHLLGHSIACVFAIEIEALQALTVFLAPLFAVADLDMSLMGVLDGIGDEVGIDLTDSHLV